MLGLIGVYSYNSNIINQLKKTKMKKVTEFKKGDLVTFFEGGFNHIVGVLMDQPDSEGAALAATSLTFGASEVDCIYLMPDQKMALFQSETPASLVSYVNKYSK